MKYTLERLILMIRTNFKYFSLLITFLFLFNKNSHAYINKTEDNFSGQVTINSIINDSYNICSINRTNVLKYECVIFSKVLSKRNDLPPEEPTSDENIIQARIERDENLYKQIRNLCSNIDLRTLDDADIFLKQAKEALRKKEYKSADYLQWKAKNNYMNVRTETYTLLLKIPGEPYEKNWWPFSGKPFEFKVNNYPTIYRSPITKTDVHTAYITISKENINLIKNAYFLTCKAYSCYSDCSDPSRESTTFEISDSILGEWKQVIESE